MGQMFIKGNEGVGLRHFFYGGSQDRLDRLKEVLQSNYPEMQIAGVYSPPFRPLSDAEDAAVIQMINESNADIIWVGLGAPKQEKWMHEHWGKDI